MKKAKHKRAFSSSKIAPLIAQKNKLLDKVGRVQSQIAQLLHVLRKENTRTDAIKEIEDSYKRNHLTHLLHLNVQYVELKKQCEIAKNSKLDDTLSTLRSALSKHREGISKLDSQIKTKRAKLANEMPPNIDGKPAPMKEKRKKVKIKGETPKEKLTPAKIHYSPIYSVSSSKAIEVFEVAWDDVAFADGYIAIKYSGHWCRKDITQSRKYLNEIKHYYKFHNAPRLKVSTAGSSISIDNQEVLFYHIDFLTIAAGTFGFIKLDPFKLKYWRKYTKKHYEINLSFAFHTNTLKRLCEYCDPDLPIIPVGEAVINTDGSKVIHNSFLFPLKSPSGYFLFWESVEESKASYVFEIESYDDKRVQNVFDFIAGDTPNKRSTLINSKDLRSRLRMKTRILHTDLNSWDIEVRALCREV